MDAHHHNDDNDASDDAAHRLITAQGSANAADTNAAHAALEKAVHDEMRRLEASLALLSDRTAAQRFAEMVSPQVWAAYGSGAYSSTGFVGFTTMRRLSDTCAPPPAPADPSPEYSEPGATIPFIPLDALHDTASDAAPPSAAATAHPAPSSAATAVSPASQAPLSIMTDDARRRPSVASLVAKLAASALTASPLVPHFSAGSAASQIGAHTGPAVNTTAEGSLVPPEWADQISIDLGADPPSPPFISPNDLLPFFSFRQRSDDEAALARLSDGLARVMRQQRAARLMAGVGGPPASALSPSPPRACPKAPTTTRSQQQQSGTAASAVAVAVRAEAMRTEQRWERLIAEADRLRDAVAAEALEHKEARAAMLRCANAELRAAEADVAALEAEEAHAAAYCEFLTQHALETLEEMNAEGFDHAKWEKRQSYTRPGDLRARFERALQQQPNAFGAAVGGGGLPHRPPSHEDVGCQAYDPHLSAAHHCTLQLLRAVRVYEGILERNTAPLAAVATEVAKCEDSLGDIVRCQRCGDGGQRHHRPTAPVGSADVGGDGEASPPSEGATTEEKGSSRRLPMFELFTLVPCGHDYCGRCVTAIDGYYPDEGGPRRCAVCGDVSTMEPILNVALTSIAQKLRFQQARARRVEDAVAAFRAAMAKRIAADA